MATSTLAPPSGAAPASVTERRPEWSPHIWEGCGFVPWLRLLWRNRFRVHWSRWYVMVIVTVVSFFNSLLGLVQLAVFGRRLRKTRITQPPIFIVGHWRTGTTHLHELLIQDPRFGYPTTYQCLEPNHFLVTEWLFTRLFWFLMPSRRPMDNMQFGFDRPQEDEFALCMLGAPSPYLSVAFPNHKPQCQEYLDLEGVPPAKLRRWQRIFKNFLKALTCRSGKRLVLKSPPHTARLKVLREMFPGACFVHIVRDPFVVFPSTVKLWKTLYKTHGLQRPTYAGLEEQVYDNFVRLYAKLEEGKKGLDPRQFFEMRYEDLIRDPEGQMQALYQHFGMDGFDDYLPRLRRYVAGLRGYETNLYRLDDEHRAQIAQRWGPIIERYGYDRTESA